MKLAETVAVGKEYTMAFHSVAYRILMSAIVTGALLSCGDGAAPGGGGGDGGGGTFAGIALIPGSVTLAPGGVQNFVASCRNASGGVVKCPDLTWTATGGTDRKSVV